MKKKFKLLFVSSILICDSAFAVPAGTYNCETLQSNEGKLLDNENTYSVEYNGRNEVKLTVGLASAVVNQSPTTVVMNPPCGESHFWEAEGMRVIINGGDGRWVRILLKTNVNEMEYTALCKKVSTGTTALSRASCAARTLKNGA